MTSRGSARHPAKTKHHHILPESKEWQAEDQPDIQPRQNTTTYSLRARNDKQRISQTSSRDKHNHIHPESKEWQAEDQPDNLQGKNTTTYKLKARNDKQGISQTFTGHKIQAHTIWEMRRRVEYQQHHPYPYYTVTHQLGNIYHR
jgi:hypothetical protein